MHPFQLAYSFTECFFCSAGPFFTFRSFLQVFYFTVVTFTATQLFVNAFQLLLQEIFALLLIDLAAGLGGDLIFKLRHLQIGLQQLDQAVGTAFDIILLQQVLLFGQFGFEVRCDKMHQKKNSFRYCVASCRSRPGYWAKGR